jgi:hypothetical protein
MSDDTRRQAALSTMWERFPAVKTKVLQVYGLQLPRHLAVFCALWESADRAEREALDLLMVWPDGLTQYFGTDGLRLVGRDGLDERLNFRYRCDPPEFVTVLMGGSDGLHYGLWYDDPAELPSFIVHNYARDAAETSTNGCPTLLTELRMNIAQMLSDYGDDGEEAQILEPLTAALDWFTAADREALEADGERRWASAPRPPGGISVFPALPPGSGDPRRAQANGRIAGFRADAPMAAEWIAQAEQELAAGLPAFALAVGGELHWLDQNRYRDQSRDLLVRAYRLLGRDALAEIVEVHTAHRDLESVHVLVPPR